MDRRGAAPADAIVVVVEDLNPFIEDVLACCPMIRSIWLVDDAAKERLDIARLYTWDLVAFADPLTLHRLRKAPRLHRGDVRLRVLLDGHRLESVWESDARVSALFASDWEQSKPGEGFYTESSTSSGLPLGGRAGKRRRAVCLWHGIDPMKGPGS
ncbi:MAG TPA: hypothetical protein VIV54_19520 [Burkholderiales bacterium]